MAPDFVDQFVAHRGMEELEAALRIFRTTNTKEDMLRLSFLPDAGGDMHVSSTSPPQVVVHLVHGTWPRGLWAHFVGEPSRSPGKPLWYEPASDFRRTLEALENVECRAFEWSGDNSVTSRALAAQSLRSELQQALVETPLACHLVIAHSHGGNVAVHALASAHSWQNGRIHGLATMGTPFLHFRKRVSRLEMRLVKLTQFICIFFLFCITVAPLHGWLSRGGVPDQVGVMGRVVSGLVVGSALIAALQWQKFATRIQRKMGRLTEMDVANVLILRAPRDEATSVLTVVHLIDTLLDRVWSMVARVVRVASTINATALQRTVLLTNPVVLSLTGMLLVQTYIFLFATTFGEQSLADILWGYWDAPNLLNARRPDASWFERCLAWGARSFVTVWLLFLPLVAGLLAIGAIILTSGAALAFFGWQLFFSGLILEVTAESTPPGGPYLVETVRPREAEFTTFGFRHGLHAVRSVRNQLVEWIESSRRAFRPSSANHH